MPHPTKPGIGSPSRWLVAWLIGAAGATVAGPTEGAIVTEATLVQDGAAQAVICVPPRVMRPDDPKVTGTVNHRSGDALRRAEYQRRRLRESVRDLARCFEKMSGARMEIVTDKVDATDPRARILVAEPAEDAVGPPNKPFPYEQGFRVVVTDRTVALVGESDLAVSYAVYEILDRLGCRWFMPTEMGEVIPRRQTVSLPAMDFSSGPATLFRDIWYCGDEYRRRNRLGGLYVSAGHALGSYLTAEQLEANPDWVAVIGGRPSPPTLKWTRPEVAGAIADVIQANLEAGEADPTSVSLSPEDQIHFDESEDPRFDAGDSDPTYGTPSLTDRLLVLCNGIAERVTARHPDLLFGMLAYANFSRPPLREKVHPNLVPVIAPITYSRVHPLTDDREPNNRDLREMIAGWGRAADMTAIYLYGWNLAEMTAPNPMITKWSVDTLYVLRHGCRFFQPETSSNFETSMHALYMAPKLAWDPTLKPEEIIDDLHRRFYGAAAQQMAAYWHFIDRIWVETPEYSGGPLGYLRRFTPERMTEARVLMDAAINAVRTDSEKARVRMADESLILFEQYMKMRRDFIEGRFEHLAAESTRWIGRTHAMAERYREQHAFSARQYGTGGIWGSNDGVDYFVQWYKSAYDEATHIDRHYDILTPEPIRMWRIRADRDKRGGDLGWHGSDFDDSAWRTTDVGIDTWSWLGLHNYLGRAWYRTRVAVPPGPPGRRTFLWIGLSDATSSVFVNGAPVSWRDRDGTRREPFAGFCRPVSFDITDALVAGSENSIAIRCDRSLNEIGSGGLIGPVMIYREPAGR